MSASDVASALRVDRDDVNRWLSGDDQPGIVAFRELARVLKRPTATFFLPSPPRDQSPNVEFRPAPGEPRRNLLFEERIAIREAARMQGVTAWLAREAGEVPLELSRVRRTTAPERAAGTVRETLGIALEEQIGWKSTSQALHGWPAALDRSGIVVLLLSMGKDGARGFSMWDDFAPLIAVNTHWNPAARAFTLLHELGHLITRTGSICAETGTKRSLPKSDDIERWCEQFAAAVLMPEEAIANVLKNVAPTLLTTSGGLPAAARISNTFSVSLRAAALRLIELGHADKELYGRLPTASDAKPKGGGAGGSGRTRTVNHLDRYGRRVATTVVTALQRDVIDSSTALRYLDLSYHGLEQLAALTSL